MVLTTTDTNGIVYFKDSSRNDKLLSVTRSSFGFSHDATLDDEYLRAGDAKSGVGEVGWVMPRNATITGLSARYGVGSATTKILEIRRNGIAMSLHDFTLISDVEFSETDLNIDLDADDLLQIYVTAADPAIGDVTVSIEVAWRAPGGIPDPRSDEPALIGTMGITVTSGTSTIQIAGPDLTSFSTTAELNAVSGTLQTQINNKSDVGHTHSHASLTGLSNDDHIQYTRVDGARGFTSTVSGVDPVLSFHLTTKAYVLSEISTLRGEMLTVSGSLQTQINQLRSELVALSGSCCSGTGEGPSGQLVSIDQIGDSENMAKATAVDIGIGNVWSVSMWVKPNSSDLTSGSRLIEIQPDSGGANVIRISTTTSPTTLLVNTIDSSNTNIKVYNYNSVLTVNVWSFLVLTWDGTNLKFYHQGSLLAPSTIQQDNVGTMTSTNRLIGVGGLRIANPAASFDGRLHSYAIWDITLSAGAISELHNSGEGAVVDYSSNGTNYTSSGDLLHWWRLGFDSADIGKDYGVHTTLIDVLDDATGIDSSDIVTDYPGM